MVAAVTFQCPSKEYFNLGSRDISKQADIFSSIKCLDYNGAISQV